MADPKSNPGERCDSSAAAGNRLDVRRRKARVAVLIGFGVLAAVMPGRWVTGIRAAPADQDAADLCRASEDSIRRGNYREALAQADGAIRAAPDFGLGYARRARAKFFLGDEHGTLKDCDEAIRRDPAVGQAYAYRAPVAGLRGSPALGVADGERAAKLIPDSAEVLSCAALAKHRAGDQKGAIALATRAIELDGKDPEAHRVRGVVAQGEDRARADFDAAVQHSGNRPFYLAARAEYLVGRAAAVGGGAADPLLDQAAADARRAIASDPRSPSAQLAEAEVQAARERRFDTLAACEKAVAANPRLVAAYLRAAEDLSPRDLRQYRLFQDALARPVDLRELKGGDFAFGALLTDLQRLISGSMKEPVTLYINYHSFAEEQRQTLRDAKVNLSTLMDATGDQLLKQVTFQTILDTLCCQVGATFWVSPESIEIVSRDTAYREMARQTRIKSFDLIAPPDLYRREEGVLYYEQALRQTIDLREFKGGDFAFGALVTEVQRLLAKKMGKDATIYVNFNSFSAEQRATLRDAKVNLSVLMDVSGDQLLTAVKVASVLSQIVRHLGEDVQVRPTSDYIEIVRVPIKQLAAGDMDCRPLRLQGKPRPEAIRWLTRGIENVPEAARLYLARGEVYLDHYDLDAAIADFSRAIDRNPAGVDAYRLRSVAYAARAKPGDDVLARKDAMATRP